MSHSDSDDNKEEPSTTELKHLADTLHGKIAEANNSPSFIHDAKQDTTAVGLSRESDGPKLVIAANTKERRETNSTDKNNYMKLKTPDGSKQKATYVDYGITETLSEVILAEVRKSPVFKRSNGRMKVEVVEERRNPRDNPDLKTMIDKAKDHASKHAESKIQAAEGENLRKIAISKEPCEGCHADLSKQGVDMKPDTPGTNKVSNRRTVNRDEVTVRNKIDRSKEWGANLHSDKTNFELSVSKLEETVKANIEGSFRPGASVDIDCGAAQLATSLEDGNFQPYVDGGALNAGAGSVQNILGGETYYARTSVLQRRTVNSVSAKKLCVAFVCYIILTVLFVYLAFRLTDQFLS